MKAWLAAVLSIGLLAGCSTLESINPFASSGPKMAEPPPVSGNVAARVVWRESVGKSDLYTFMPATVNTSVFAAGADGSLVRIDDGRQAWRINAGQPLSGGVGVDDKRVVVGSPKGDVLAFSSTDGTPLWKSRVGSEILSPPAVGEGLVIVRSGDNRLTAFDATDGTRKWVYQRPIPALSLRVTAPPVIDGKFVFVGFPGGKLVAVNLNNGAAQWDGTVAVPKGATELDRVADLVTPPVISGRSICAVAFQGRVACFDLGNGNTLWSRDMSSSVGLTVDNRNLYVTDDKGAVHALDMASGASLWKQDKLYLRRVTAPVVRRGVVAVADAQGLVHLLSREDGSFVGRISTDGGAVVAPIQVSGNQLLLQTRNGGLFAIEIQ